MVVVPELLSGPKPRHRRRAAIRRRPVRSDAHVSRGPGTSKATTASPSRWPRAAASAGRRRRRRGRGAAPRRCRASPARPPAAPTVPRRRRRAARPRRRRPATTLASRGARARRLPAAEAPAPKAPAAKSAAARDGRRPGHAGRWWAVQLGSFASKANAEKLVQQLEVEAAPRSTVVASGAGPSHAVSRADRARLRDRAAPLAAVGKAQGLEACGEHRVTRPLRPFEFVTGASRQRRPGSGRMPSFDEWPAFGSCVSHERMTVDRSRCPDSGGLLGSISIGLTARLRARGGIARRSGSWRSGAAWKFGPAGRAASRRSLGRSEDRALGRAARSFLVLVLLIGWVIGMLLGYFTAQHGPRAARSGDRAAVRHRARHGAGRADGHRRRTFASQPGGLVGPVEVDPYGETVGDWLRAMVGERGEPWSKLERLTGSQGRSAQTIDRRSYHVRYRRNGRGRVRSISGSTTR